MDLVRPERSYTPDLLRPLQGTSAPLTSVMLVRRDVLQNRAVSPARTWKGSTGWKTSWNVDAAVGVTRDS